MSYDADDQQVWEAQVRAEIRRLGYDPAEEEADADGFGQDYLEYKDDPKGFAKVVLAENASRHEER